MDGARRKAISVMFMTFIAVSILAATFITMYLYLTQHNLTATEAQRIYAEAAQERLEVILDRRAGDILINDTGGIGVTLKYLVGLDSSAKTADIRELSTPVIIPAGSGITLHVTEFPSGELYVMSERGNLFKAIPGGFSFELEANPANVVLGKGGSAEVTLKLKAALLKTPESGMILLVARPEGCLMTRTLTTTITTTMTLTIFGVEGRYATLTVEWRTKGEGWATTTVTVVTSLVPAGEIERKIVREYKTNYTTTASFVKFPQPTAIATFTTRTATTVITPITLTAEDLEWWIGGPECFIVYKAVNATSGSVLAEAWVRVKAQ
jgi:hypothetical protein